MVEDVLLTFFRKIIKYKEPLSNIKGFTKDQIYKMIELNYINCTRHGDGKVYTMTKIGRQLLLNSRIDEITNSEMMELISNNSFEMTGLCEVCGKKMSVDRFKQKYLCRDCLMGYNADDDAQTGELFELIVQKMMADVKEGLSA